MRICISVGHGRSAGGGYDSGAVGGGFHEFRIARKIGFYIAEALKNYGCDAVLINYDADMYLTDRIAYVNRENFDLAAEIHLNAGGGTGSEVYYKHTDEGGKKLAAKISEGIAKTFSLRDRGAKTKLNSAGGDYFGFVRSVRCRSLLIETVFIDSSSDRKNVETEAGQKKCGESIAASIAEFYGLCVKNEPRKVAQYADIRAGDRVKIIGKNYATGQRVPSWVKLRTHTVAKVEPSRALLKEINSWVRLSDLRLARERCFYKVRCGLRRLHLGARKARARFSALAEKAHRHESSAEPRHARSPARRYLELGRGRQSRGGVR